jgi:hypothetical protein
VLPRCFNPVPLDASNFLLPEARDAPGPYLMTATPIDKMASVAGTAKSGRGGAGLPGGGADRVPATGAGGGGRGMATRGGWQTGLLTGY